MSRVMLKIWRRFFGTASAPIVAPCALRVRLHIPRSIRRSLAAAVAPNERRPEPLALLRVRYAAEERRDVIVGVGITPFPDTAYFDGINGANFDTRWVVDQANQELRSNAGVLLVHGHGGKGMPQFSSVDRKTNREVMARLSIGVETAPYGAMVLSTDAQQTEVTVGGSLAPADVVVVPDALVGAEQ